MKHVTFISLIVLLFTASLLAQETKIVKLPPPQKEIGKPLMEALSLRQSTRVFDTQAIPQQELSNLLWAAFGINREKSGKRTAPSAMNWQEVDIYVFTSEGVYLYNAKDNSLMQVASGDLRALAGKQDFVKDAPLNFVYVADFSKTGKASHDDQLLYSGADTGFIAENVYLYCASQGLSVVVRGMVDREALAKKLNLKPEQKVILAQTIGYPKK